MRRARQPQLPTDDGRPLWEGLVGLVPVYALLLAGAALVLGFAYLCFQRL